MYDRLFQSSVPAVARDKEIEGSSVYPTIGAHGRQLCPGEGSFGFCLIGTVNDEYVVRASAAKNVAFGANVFAWARINQQTAPVLVRGDTEIITVAMPPGGSASISRRDAHLWT